MAQSFKLYNCDVGIKVDSVSYDFQHIAEIQIEDPERNQLTRGSNAGNDEGIIYREGLKEPKRWTIPILNMSSDLKTVLDNCYKNQTRLDVYCVDRVNQSSKMLKKAILSNKPQQLSMDETPESMNVSLEFVGYVSDEVFKE